jgi:regulatory protein
MKVTDIKRQVSRKNWFNIFVDGQYAFSLNQTSIVENQLKIGQNLDQKDLVKLKQISNNDKIYAQTLRLVAARPKSQWEVKTYLERHGLSPAAINEILNKLSNMQLVNDYNFAEVYLRSLKLHSPASRRKIIAKLKQKHIDPEVIYEVIKKSEVDDRTALSELVALKKSQYKDQRKLMAYLARQGFNYSDIKEALGT